MSEYFLKPYSSYRDVKVEVDLFNNGTKINVNEQVFKFSFAKS